MYIAGNGTVALLSSARTAASILHESWAGHVSTIVISPHSGSTVQAATVEGLGPKQRPLESDGEAYGLKRNATTGFLV